MKLLQLFVSDKLELCLLLKQHVLVGVLLVKLPLFEHFIADLLLGLSYGPLLLVLHLLIVELFLLALSLLHHEEALLDFLVPKFVDVFFFVLLDILQVSGHLVQEQGSIVFVTVRHVLLVVRMFEVLELAIHERARCEVEGQRWLV